MWDSEQGLCLEGFWDLHKVLGWTEPSTDSQGRIVTHIKANSIFNTTRLGGMKSGFNPMGLEYVTVDQDHVAAKFNDGWLIVPSD